MNFGIVRLQTANVRFDWEHTSVVAGQDSLFISPLSPTSFASLATPAFAFAGNLWGWTPQLRVEHRFSLSDQQTITVQAGVLDNLDWEYPYNSFYRSAQAGEMSGPTRLCVSHGVVASGAGASAQLRRRRLLWPPELDLGPRCRRLGWNGGLADSHSAAACSVGRVLSRPRHWRTRRRDWNFDCVRRRSVRDRLSSDPRARHRRRMGATEISVDSEDGTERRVRRRRCLCRRHARLRHRREQFRTDSGTKSRRAGKCRLSSSLRPGAFGGVPTIAHLPHL